MPREGVGKEKETSSDVIFNGNDKTQQPAVQQIYFAAAKVDKENYYATELLLQRSRCHTTYEMHTMD